MTKQLSKESLFAYRVLQQAARKAGGYPEEVGGRDTNIVVAGGAVRDLYFDRESRDLDIYYDVSRISAREFATSLKNIDAKKMAQQFGFDSIEIVRLSDNSKMGTGGEGEDWGDVDDSKKKLLTAFVDYIIYFQNLGESFSVAVAKSRAALPQVVPLLQSQGYEYKLVQKLLADAGVMVNATRSNSGSGSKQGRAHPLKSVEEFNFFFNGDRWNPLCVELMAVDQPPVDYICEHFAVKLSRAYFDGHGVHFTPDFMQDARNKTITIACPVEHARFERLFSYYLPKMKNYFPDFEIRVDLNAMNRSGW